MDFRRINEWKTTQLRMALKENNTKELEYLRKKKDTFFLNYLLEMDFEKVSREMIDIFVNKFTDENWERWGAKPGMQKDLVVGFMRMSMHAGRADLFSLFFDTSPDLNKGDGKDHVIGNILTSKMPAETKMELIGKIAAQGLDKVTDLQSLAVMAHTANLPAPFDLLAGLSGLDVRKDNELLLRTAARAGNEAIAEHLVVKYGADLRLAITTEKTLGNETSWNLLEGLRQKLNPAEETPPTIESLSAEMRALKAMVRELTAEVRAQNAPERRLDKPTLNRPGML